MREKWRGRERETKDQRCNVEGRERKFQYRAHAMRTLGALHSSHRITRISINIVPFRHAFETKFVMIGFQSHGDSSNSATEEDDADRCVLQHVQVTPRRQERKR